MSRTTAWLSAYLLLSCCVLPLAAQQTSATATDAVVPPLVNFSGVLTDVNNKPLSGAVGVTFALYADAQGGAPLWVETQNVQPDKTGHYSVLLGSTLGQGLPSNLFASGTARWLGVQAQGQTGQPRVLLVAVPYALKALDAETIGGKPASAFALATPAGTSAATNPVQPTATQSASATGSPSISGSGKPGYISEWSSTTKLGDSALFQSSAGNLGISTITPAQKFEIDLGNMLVRGADNFSKSGDTAYVYVGDAHHTVEAMYASGLAIGAYKVPQAIFIQDKTGNVGIGTTTPAAGILTTVANSAKVVGLSTTGWNAPNGSSANGFDAIHATGGNADQNANTDLNGGAGLIATGGLGFSADGEGNWGPGVVANGGSANGGGNSGDGIDANGGNGDILFSEGGNGITAAGGTGVFGGAGGVFTGGGGRYGTGDGIDVAGGNGPSPITVAYFCCTGNNQGVDFSGDFSGDINVTGAIYAGTKDFRIDHPLDPANKYLVHASVESSEMMNIYTGNATLNDKGEASVQLPGWFEAVNGDFRYQLTAIGRPSPGLYVAQEISGNQFQIAGGAPGTKVSWQVIGVRHDAYAKANPLQVEREKTFERGYYIHPELYGAPEERGIEWLRHPAFMKHAKQVRIKQRATSWSTRGISAIPSSRPVAAGSIPNGRQ